MKKKVATGRGILAALGGLTDEELLAFQENSGKVKEYLAELAREMSTSIFFTALGDEDAVRILVGWGRSEENARSMVNAWRQYCAATDYRGPIVWQVREGFTLKTHAPKAGPCYESFQYLQNWPIQNEELTKSSLVFWIPRLVAGSKVKRNKDRFSILAALREQYKMPSHHLVSFGDIALVSGLILAHFKRVGERTPLNGDWAYTDTLNSDGDRLRLGAFVSDGLCCAHWFWDGDHGSAIPGFFPVGVELDK